MLYNIPSPLNICIYSFFFLMLLSLASSLRTAPLLMKESRLYFYAGLIIVVNGFFENLTQLLVMERKVSDIHLGCRTKIRCSYFSAAGNLLQASGACMKLQAVWGWFFNIWNARCMYWAPLFKLRHLIQTACGLVRVLVSCATDILGKAPYSGNLKPFACPCVLCTSHSGKIPRSDFLSLVHILVSSTPLFQVRQLVQTAWSLQHVPASCAPYFQ